MANEHALLAVIHGKSSRGKSNEVSLARHAHCALRSSVFGNARERPRRIPTFRRSAVTHHRRSMRAPADHLEEQVCRSRAVAHSRPKEDPRSGSPGRAHRSALHAPDPTRVAGASVTFEAHARMAWRRSSNRRCKNGGLDLVERLQRASVFRPSEFGSEVTARFSVSNPF